MTDAFGAMTQDLFLALRAGADNPSDSVPRMYARLDRIRFGFYAAAFASNRTVFKKEPSLPYRRSQVAAILVVSVGLAAQCSAFGSPIPTYTVTDLGKIDWDLRVPEGDPRSLFDQGPGIVRNLAGDQTYIFRPSQLVSIPVAQFASLVESVPQLRNRGLGEGWNNSTVEAWQNPSAPEYAVFKLGPDPSISSRANRYTDLYEARRGESGEWELVGHVAGSPGNNGPINLIGISATGQALALSNTGQEWGGSWFHVLYDPNSNSYVTPINVVGSVLGPGHFPIWERELFSVIDEDGRILELDGEHIFLLTPTAIPLAAPVPEPSALIVLLAGGAFVVRRSVNKGRHEQHMKGEPQATHRSS